MHRRKSLFALSAAGAIAAIVLLTQPQLGNALQSSSTSQQGAQPGVSGAADKAAARQQAKQAAANKAAGSTGVSFEQPINFPNDI